MLIRFELEYPRRHHIERMGDKWNRENCGGCGGRDHTFFHYTAPSGTVLIAGIKSCLSYRIKCFNSNKWGHYENQCPEPMRDETANNLGNNLAQIGRCLAQGSSGGAVSNNGLLLDYYSNIICSKNNSSTSNINMIPLEEHFWVYSYGGHTEYTIMITLETPLYGHICN